MKNSKICFSFRKEGELIMAKNNEALKSMKQQAANEVGVTLKENGYNGDLTARQAGSIGGQMVKKMIESYQGK